MFKWVNYRETFLITHNGLKITYAPRTLEAVEERPHILRLHNHILNITLFVKDGRVHAFVHESRTTFLLKDVPPPLAKRLLGYA